MKIALLCRSLHVGGTERQLVQIALDLKRLGWDVQVLLFYKQGPLVADLAAASIPCIDLGKRGRWDIVRFSRNMLAILRAERPDVLFSFLSAANVVAALCAWRLPWLRLVWGIRNTAGPRDQLDTLARLVWSMERKLAAMPRLLIANSRLAATAWAIHCQDRGKAVMTLQNGIDTDRYAPPVESKTQLRLALRLPEAGPCIGIVARLTPQKDHRTFLRALALLAHRDLPFSAAIVGAGDRAYEQELRQFAAEMGIAERLHWLGEMHDMPRVYGALDVSVLCSLTEGFPNALAEAMSCGIPCVSTDVGDAADIVDDPAYLVPRADPAALADAIAKSLQADRPAAALRARIGRHFDRTVQARKLDGALRALADG